MAAMLDADHSDMTLSAAARFIRPGIADLHADAITRWKGRYPSLLLATEMLDNPRLTDRIVCEIAGDPLDLEDEELAQSAMFQPIAALITHGVDKVAQITGMAWHRPTVIDWVTWNQLGDLAPDMTLQDARLAINAASEATRAAAGAPKQSEDGLTGDDVTQTGHRLLGMWQVSLPVKVAVRLKLFAKTVSSRPHPVAEEFVHEVTVSMLNASKEGGADGD